MKSVQPWWSRLDDWQHEHMPSDHGSPLQQLSQSAWYWLWRPYCNWVDRRYLR
jgi:hypothetical protein